MIDECECPWCGYDLADGCADDPENEIWKEGERDIECPACGMRLSVYTDYVACFYVDAKALDTCKEGGCRFYGFRCCAGSLEPGLEPPEGVPAWCPRLKRGHE